MSYVIVTIACKYITTKVTTLGNTSITPSCSSYHVCCKAISMEDPTEFEHHMCPNPKCSRAFPDLPRSAWRRHQDDTCLHCGKSRRFKMVAGQPVPTKRYVTCLGTLELLVPVKKQLPLHRCTHSGIMHLVRFRLLSRAAGGGTWG